jgi:hypothetical protein
VSESSEDDGVFEIRVDRFKEGGGVKGVTHRLDFLMMPSEALQNKIRLRLRMDPLTAAELLSYLLKVKKEVGLPDVQLPDDEASPPHPTRQ